MAIGNRTETQSVVTSTIVPTVTNSIHRSLLNDTILAGIVFRKDVIGTETPSAGTVTIDFSNKDCATITTAVNISINIGSIQNGDVKYIVLTKALTNTVAFPGSIDYTYWKNEINTIVNYVAYQVLCKDGIVYVQAIYSPVQPVNAGFASISLATGWTGYVKWQNNLISGKVEVEVSVTKGTGGDNTVCTIPLAIRPDRVILNSWFSDLSSNNEKSFGINTSGDLYMVGTPALSELFFAYVEYYKTLP